MKRKVISFGKIAYCRNRKENEVEIDIELYSDKDNNKILDIIGIIWNRTHTGALLYDNSLDIIKEYINGPLFDEIHELWGKYQYPAFLSKTDLNRIEKIISSC